MPNIIVILLSILLFSCTTQTTQPPKPSELEAQSSVTVKDPSFQPEKDQAIAWLQSLTWVGLPAGTEVQDWTDFIETTIQHEFETKGYQVVDGNAQYQILAFIVMDEMSSHPDLEALFQLYPDVGKSATQRERGTLILALVPHKASPIPSIQTAWRGAIQIFRANDGELKESAGRDRVGKAIKALMNSIPSPKADG